MREFNVFFLNIFFGNPKREHGMQNGEGEGCSAPGRVGAAGRQAAQELTDRTPTAESIFAQVRQLEQQHAVIVWSFAMFGPCD